ncbi:hypothetical protein L9F63_002377 [Diploptera punctata]|uniref:F1F0-ATP synthase delta subunit C-terminal domain-containing protein n=1 Tax=Diploptera punctata TaxID=6984 RepID=A0AAD8A2B6_DIPPU|nr:hypothetical protein L9F63_002377 [Diploptera punctata]
MAAITRSIRPAMRLLSLKQVSTVASVRGYAEMPFTFAAGNQVFYDNADIKQVDVPSFSGSLIFVSSGTISINEDSSVQILAEEGCTLDQLDAAAAREVLSKAQSDLSSASTDVAKAEAAIAVEVAEALVKAAE